ncbi:MAG: type II secretion system protein [Phycisphaerales bacterium]|jgi:prepilin-type N-terminal cleavage/methylation domain-containing protein
MIRRGFTLTEMLVVIAVIGILMALLLGGIQRARAAGRSTQQLSNIRQVHMGWTLYAGQFGEECLPGFLSGDVQQRWRVSYKMKDRVAGVSSDRFDRTVTQTYPWRLMPYLDHSLDVMMGYRVGDDDGSATWSLEMPPAPLPGGLTLPTEVQPLLDNGSLLGRTVALQPAFGYNAFYLGGWWEMSAGANPEPTYRFRSVPPSQQVAQALGKDATRSIEVVTRKVGTVRQPERMVAFCSSTFSPQLGGSFDAASKPEPNAGGAAWCRPPFLGATAAWSTGQLGGDSVWVRTSGAVPLMRYGNDVATALVDGSTRAATARELTDMRAWVNLPDVPNAIAEEPLHADDR